MTSGDQNALPPLGSREEQEAAIEVMAQRIEEHCGTLLRRTGGNVAELSRALAGQVFLWQALGGESGGNLNLGFGPELHRAHAESLSEQAKQVRKALDDLVNVLVPPDWAEAEHQLDKFGPLGTHLAKAAEARGVDVRWVTAALYLIDDAVRRGEQEGRRDYREWLKDYSGNKPKAMSRLRLSLDNCLKDKVQPRKTRARIIAATLVATGVIDPSASASAARATEQTIREREKKGT